MRFDIMKEISICLSAVSLSKVQTFHAGRRVYNEYLKQDQFKLLIGHYI